MTKKFWIGLKFIILLIIFWVNNNYPVIASCITIPCTEYEVTVNFDPIYTNTISESKTIVNGEITGVYSWFGFIHLLYYKGCNGSTGTYTILQGYGYNPKIVSIKETNKPDSICYPENNTPTEKVEQKIIIWIDYFKPKFGLLFNLGSMPAGCTIVGVTVNYTSSKPPSASALISSSGVIIPDKVNSFSKEELDFGYQLTRLSKGLPINSENLDFLNSLPINYSDPKYDLAYFKAHWINPTCIYQPKPSRSKSFGSLFDKESEIIKNILSFLYKIFP